VFDAAAHLHADCHGDKNSNADQDVDCDAGDVHPDSDVDEHADCVHAHANLDADGDKHAVPRHAASVANNQPIKRLPCREL
jgi:hypothetical protein